MYILIPACLCIAGLFIWQERKGKFVLADVLKGIASLCFVILGLLCSHGIHPAKLIVAGLILGCIADVLLNLRFIFQDNKGQMGFLAGIVVFLAGHVMYLTAILPMAKSWILCVLVGIVLTAVIMRCLFLVITAKRVFKIFGIFYIGVIVILNCVAIANMITAPSMFTRVFAAGAFLFLISDIVLILNTFGPVQKFSLRLTNLSLYYIGQILIALSLQYLG